MTGLPEITNAVFSRQRMVDLLGEHAVRVGLRNGVLAQPWRGVLVFTQRGTEFRVRAEAALLAVGDGGVLSASSAAALHGCSAADQRRLHITVPYSRWVRSRDDLVVHHDNFEPEDLTAVDGFPVLTADLAIADVLCTEPRRNALACADQAIAIQPESRRDLFRARVAERLVTRANRRGTQRAEAILTLATGLAESPPESWLRMLLADSGFPLPVAQFPVRDLDGHLLYRLDMAWPELRIAVEYDGYEAHENRKDTDAKRDADLGSRGWIIVRATATDLRRPNPLLANLCAAFAARGTNPAARGAKSATRTAKSATGEAKSARGG